MATDVGNCRSRRADEAGRPKGVELFKGFFVAAVGTRGIISKIMESGDIFSDETSDASAAAVSSDDEKAPAPRTNVERRGRDVCRRVRRDYSMCSSRWPSFCFFVRR